MLHSYTIYCVCCQREVNRNCTVLSPDEFALARNNSHWYCKLCNEDIFPFNHIENDSEFRQALHDFNTSQCLDPLDPDSEIFDPFEINDDSDHIVEYQGELDPDKNYFNQFSYHLSQSSNYYCEDSFNKCIDRCNMNKDLFSLIHLNIRSLPANLTGFMSYMSNVNHIFSIIGFTETWLKPSNIETFGIAGYNYVGLTKQSGKGGGVSLFISDDIVYSEIQELNMVEDHIECIFIKINIRGHTYFIGLVYRPPNSNITEFSNTMHSILDKVASKPSYIMGDYNLDLLKHEIHHPTEILLDIMYANYFIPLINRPTRITRESSTFIDNIFSYNYNVNDHQVNGILKTDITDHYIIFHILSLKVEKSCNDEHKIVLIINSTRTQRYIEKIRNTDWSILESYQKCQTYFSKFLKMFKNIYDDCFPVIKVKTQYRNRLPWLSEGLKLSIKHKNKLYRTSLKHPTEYDISIYKNYRNKLTSLLKIEEKHFYQNQITSNKNDLRKVWAIIKNVINKNKSKKKSDQFISNNKKKINPNEIANGFNDYFVNIGPTLAAKITSEGPSYKIFMHNDCHMSFFIDPANEAEIMNMISHLKEGAPGRDEIVARNLKCISDSIAYPLAQVANLSFQQGIFPEELKIAAVTPLYKDPMMFNNYRPISLISVFAKILERLMYNSCLSLSINIKFLTNTSLDFAISIQHLWH